jgi:cyclase
VRTRFVEVAPDVYAVLGSNGMPNAAVVDGGEDGVVVIDSLFTPAYAEEMMTALREVTDAPVKALINTHFHGDHTFGNPGVPTDRIIAHERAHAELERIGEEYLVELCGRRPDLAPELVGAGVRIKNATETFGDEGMTLSCGDMTLELRFHDALAHTDHDITVFIPERGVLIAADLVVEGVALFMHHGELFGLQDVLNRLPREGVQVIIPGHGEVGGTELIDDNLQQIAEIVEVTENVIAAGGDEAAARKAGLEHFAGMFGAEQRVPDSMGQAYAKLAGERA